VADDDVMFEADKPVGAAHAVAMLVVVVKFTVLEKDEQFVLTRQLYVVPLVRLLGISVVDDVVTELHTVDADVLYSTVYDVALATGNHVSVADVVEILDVVRPVGTTPVALRLDALITRVRHRSPGSGPKPFVSVMPMLVM
jgi:hypothetical protein